VQKRFEVPSYIVRGVLVYEGASWNSFSLPSLVAVQITTTLNCLNSSVEHNLLPGNVTLSESKLIIGYLLLINQI